MTLLDHLRVAREQAAVEGFRNFEIALQRLIEIELDEIEAFKSKGLRGSSVAGDGSSVPRLQQKK